MYDSSMVGGCHSTAECIYILSLQILGWEDHLLFASSGKNGIDE